MRNKLLFFITILLVATAVSFTFDQAQNEPIKAPLNPAFIRYIDSLQMGLRINGPPIGDYAGERPSPVDMSHVVSSQGSGQTLPSFYDLRTQNKLTAVKDQGDCASCWAFATLASLESFLMPPAYNFSEQDLIEDHRFDYAECGGGNVFMSTAYLARWDGAARRS